MSTPTNELALDLSDSELVRTLIPDVRFQIPHESSGEEYLEWLKILFREFISSLSDHPVNKFRSERFAFPPNAGQGGLGAIYIGDEYMREDEKITAHDGETSTASALYGWKGMVIYNHHSLSHSILPVYRLAQHFADFLRGKSIEFECFGMARAAEGKVEIVLKWGRI